MGSLSGRRLGVFRRFRGSRSRSGGSGFFRLLRGFRRFGGRFGRGVFCRCFRCIGRFGRSRSLLRGGRSHRSGKIADGRRDRRHGRFFGSRGQHFAGIDRLQFLRFEHGQQNCGSEENSCKPGGAFLKHVSGVGARNGVHHSTAESSAEAFLLRALHQDDENEQNAHNHNHYC